MVKKLLANRFQLKFHHDKRELAVLKVEVDAVENVARLVARLRVGDALEHRRELGLLERMRLLVAKLRQRGKFFLADAHDAES